MEKWFGRWNGLLASVLLSLSIVAAILVTCGCCCIPCLRRLFQRLIETTLTTAQCINTTWVEWGWQQATQVWWRQGCRWRLKRKAVPCMNPSKFSMICWMENNDVKQWCRRYTRLCKVWKKRKTECVYMNLLWVYTFFSSSINRREMLEKYHEVILWERARCRVKKHYCTVKGAGKGLLSILFQLLSKPWFTECLITLCG